MLKRSLPASGFAPVCPLSAPSVGEAGLVGLAGVEEAVLPWMSRTCLGSETATD